MSNEVTEYLVSRGELLRADNLRPAEVNRLVDAEAYRALEAECERLKHSQQVLMQSRNAHRDERDKLRQERDTLAAELAAIRSAGGEQVEVVAEVVSKYGDPEAFGERELVRCKPLCNVPYKTELMTVAQHQRIVAAMAAELEKFKQANRELSESNVRRRDSELKMRAELEAARKQEPAHWWRDGVDGVEYCQKPFTNDWHPLYALPPLAGKVSVPRELLRRVCWPVVSGSDRHTHSEAVAELRALLATPSMEV